MKFLTIIILVTGIGCAAGCNKDTQVTLPEIMVNPVSVMEGNSGDVMADIKLSLAGPAREDISISWSTEDGTAISGKDYSGQTDGQITLPAGSSSINLSIPILHDELLEFTEYFTLNLEEPENATLSNNSIRVKIQDNDKYVPESDADGVFTPDNYPDLTLAWAEEFDAPAIDTDAWTFELGDGCPNICGWGNNELQHYTDKEENARIIDGRLVITAIKNDGGIDYTSARMITRGKKEFRYGRIDIRARLPYGQGIWPALWMLGANIGQLGWPRCGEIDIMELVGHEPGVTHGTAHYDAGGHQYRGSLYRLPFGEQFSEKFHVFSILWEKDNIKWYLDYNKIFEISRQEVGSTWPFNNPFFFILNIAVGGNWPDNPDETTVFPQTMEVDYIRVFQQETPGE
jgi:beta-glucanase (GH16 family)